MGQTSQDFRILGDLSVTIGGEARPITAARQRAALTILLLSANRTVSSMALFEGIWGADLPQHPDTALQIVISRLRASLGPAAGRLVSSPSGYRLEVAADELDLSRVQATFAEGQRLAHANDPSRAADVLTDALARWTAEPLYDLVAYPFCAAARSRLHQMRMSICEVRNDALLAAGRHLQLLETIDEWIALEPWREKLRVQQVLALYRSGRQVDALRAYDEYRDRLVDELGVEPSSELSELHRDVLTHAPRLAIAAGLLGTRVPLWTSLCMPFVGRTEEEERIFGFIRDVFAGDRSMVLVEGEVGIGKTRLILEIARRVHGDAFVLSLTANDSMVPAVVGLAQVAVTCALQLPDDELARCLGSDVAVLAAVVPALRDRLAALAIDFELDPAGRTVDPSPRLGAAVAACLTALSRRAPIVLLVDDLHRGGAPLMKLLGRLMVVDAEQRILVLASARAPVPDRSSNLADLAEQLERYGRLRRVPLAGIGASSVERLLCRLGAHESTVIAERLHAVTGGQPFFLSQILQTENWQRALEEPPAGVREFVWRRVHSLGDPEAAMLLDAAALGVAFDAALLSEIAGVTPAAAGASIDRAVGAGLLRTVGKCTFTFVHELCRRALLDRLDDEARASLHRRVAMALEARGFPASVLALHWKAVPGADAAERASRYACLAEEDFVLGAADHADHLLSGPVRA